MREVGRFLLALLLALTVVATTGGAAQAARGGAPGTGTLSFNPAADTEGNHLIAPWGIDLNVALHVSESLLVFGDETVKAGQFYIPLSGWFTNTEWPADIRAALVAQGYHFAAATPIQDFLAKLEAVKYVVDEGTSQQHTWTFTPGSRIARLTTVGDLLAGVPEFEPFLSLPSESLLGKLAPEPVGTHTVSVVWTMSERHDDGLGLVEGVNILPAGDTTPATFVFHVAPRSRS